MRIFNYKRWLVLAGLMFLLLTPGFSKEPAGGQNLPTKFLLGLRAGVDFDQHQGTHLEENFKGYFMGGAYLGIQFNRIRIKGEALFSQSQMTTGNGFKDAFHNFVDQAGDNLSQGTFKMNEFSVPLIFSYNLIYKLVWVEIGPQYTAVVSIKDPDDFVQNVKSVVKDGYVSGLVGLNVDLPLHLIFNVRYVVGLSNRNNTSVPEHWKSNHVQATVGLRIL